jgi:hypothetical protein
VCDEGELEGADLLAFIFRDGSLESCYHASLRTTACERVHQHNSHRFCKIFGTKKMGLEIEKRMGQMSSTSN